MIRIEDEIFLKKKFDFEKLKEFGFCFENNTYTVSYTHLTLPTKA